MCSKEWTVGEKVELVAVILLTVTMLVLVGLS